MMTTFLARAAWVTVLLLSAAGVWWLMQVLPRATLPEGHAILCLSPDGRFLATRSTGGVTIWNVATARPAVALPAGFLDWQDWQFTFSPDGHWLAGSRGDVYRLWELPGGRELTTVPFDKDALEGVKFYRNLDCAQFSPDGAWVAFRVECPDHTQKLTLWDLAQGRERVTLAGRKSWVPEFLWSPDGKSLAFETADLPSYGPCHSRLHVWDSESGVDKPLADSESEALRVLAFSPDSRTLVAGDGFRSEGAKRSPELKPWNLSTGKAGAAWGLTRGASRVRFTSDGSRLLVETSLAPQGRDDWQLIVIDPGAEPPAGMMARHVGPCYATSSQDGCLMATATQECGDAVSILELPDAATRLALKPEHATDRLVPQEFARQGNLLAVIVRCTRRPSPSVFDWVRKVLGLAPAPSLAEGEGPTMVNLYDTAKGHLLGAIATASDAKALFTPDGRTLISVTSDGRPALWDVPLHKPWPRIVAWWALLAACLVTAALLRRPPSAGMAKPPDGIRPVNL
jgi:WD40 repeat protein